MIRNRSVNFALAGLIVGAIPLLVASLLGCHNDPIASTKVTAISDKNYIGNDACKPCHADVYKLHHGSFHDTTMRHATVAELGDFLPPTGVIPLAGYRFEQSGDSLAVARTLQDSPSSQIQKLDMVLGSGKLGMTYVSCTKNDGLMEIGMSYFPPYKLWEVTPGQEVHLVTDQPFGRDHVKSDARMCITCHSTLLPFEGNGVEPEPKLFGVGCESCHGAGKSHVEAMRLGKPEIQPMAKLGNLSPTKLNELCGKCHRNVANVDLDSPEVSLTHRFQPYALQRSSCRTNKQEPLSCLNCHNVHTNATKNVRQYEAVCLSCHSALPGQPISAKTVPSVESNLQPVEFSKGKTCPVNGKDGCISCHMRPKKVFPGTAVPAVMADHLISIPGSDIKRVTPRLDSLGSMSNEQQRLNHN